MSSVVHRLRVAPNKISVELLQAFPQIINLFSQLFPSLVTKLKGKNTLMDFNYDFSFADLGKAPVCLQKQFSDGALSIREFSAEEHFGLIGSLRGRPLSRYVSNLNQSESEKI